MLKNKKINIIYKYIFDIACLIYKLIKYLIIIFSLLTTRTSITNYNIISIICYNIIEYINLWCFPHKITSNLDLIIFVLTSYIKYISKWYLTIMNISTIYGNINKKYKVRNIENNFNVIFVIIKQNVIYYGKKCCDYGKHYGYKKIILVLKRKYCLKINVYRLMEY